MRKSVSGAQGVESSPESVGKGAGRKLPVAKVLRAAPSRRPASVRESAGHREATRAVESTRASGRDRSPNPEPPRGAEAIDLRLPPGPTSARAILAELHRESECERRWRLPCWLASLLLHMLAVVVFGSLTAPIVRQRSVISILLEFGAGDAHDEEPIDITTAMLPLEEQAVEAQLGLGQVDLFPEGEIRPPQTSAPRLVESISQPGDAPDSPRFDALSMAAPGAPAVEPTVQTAVAPADRFATTAIANLAIECADEEHEEIVERFIEFDVGRLTGAPGAKARQDFDRLGVEAIASLIRGINRSATMHASCPVMVISNKVESLLREYPDPALLRYALDNIGKEVPANAPHFGRLQGLLAQLRQIDPKALSRSKTLATLRSRNGKQILTAVELLMAECDEMSDLEKRELAWELIRLLTHRDAHVRQAAHEGLITLADGADFGPSDNRRAANRFAAAGQWSLHFDPERYEAAAASVLKSGQHLDDAGQAEAARQYYRKVIREFPGTTGAARAVERLSKQKAVAFNDELP